VDYFNTAARLIRIYGSIPRCIPLVNGRALPPLFLFLELTYRCNLRCPYCYVYSAGRKPKLAESEELTAAEIAHIVDQTLPWTLVFLSGGEPLVRKDFAEIVESTAQRRLCHIYTNGTMINQADAEQWVAVGVSSVAFSVDGPEGVHDAIRGKGAYSSSMSAVEMLSIAKKRTGKKFPLINLRSTITARNADSLSEMVSVAQKAGADYCTFQVLNHTTRLGGIDLQDNLESNLPLAPIEEFPAYILAHQLPRLRNATSSALRVRILPDLPDSALLNHYENHLQTRDYRCVSPWTVMYVSPYGEAYPCLNFRVGNLREQPLRSLWNGHRYRQFRLRLLSSGLFADCCGCCDLLRRRSFITSSKPTANPSS